jgi:hypothetical protein
MTHCCRMMGESVWFQFLLRTAVSAAEISTVIVRMLWIGHEHCFLGRFSYFVWVMHKRTAILANGTHISTWRSHRTHHVINTAPWTIALASTSKSWPIVPVFCYASFTHCTKWKMTIASMFRVWHSEIQLTCRYLLGNVHFRYVEDKKDTTFLSRHALAVQLGRSILTPEESAISICNSIELNSATRF